MPDPNTEHGLRVQLATALRERDTAREDAAYFKASYARKLQDEKQLLESASATVEEHDALSAEMQRLRKVLELYRSCRHASVECFCFKEARAALATGGDRG